MNHARTIGTPSNGPPPTGPGQTIGPGLLCRIFACTGILSFGGPAAQIALMLRALVDDHKLLTEKQFLGALSFCMLLPGPEALQLATYSGWRLRGTLGGLIAGLLFVLPGAALILALAIPVMIRLPMLPGLGLMALAGLALHGVW